MSARDRQVALVSGAAGEIGRATALRLRVDGWSLVLTDPDAAGGRATAAALGAEHAAFEPLDPGRPDELPGLIERAVAHFGEFAALVHGPLDAPAAGFLDPGDEDALDGLYAAQLRTPLALDRAVARRMQRAGGGAIVHVVPASALEPAPGLALASATGGAIVAAARTLARELRDLRIRVNLVVARTPSDDRAREVMPERSGDGGGAGAVSPEDVADAIAHLLGPDATALVGATVHVTAGEPMAR